MAITVTPNLTDISLCEATTGWSAGTVNSDFALQGTYCLGVQAKAATSALVAYTMSATNMTGKHIYIWMMVTGLADTKANGGYRIYVETNSTNYGYWYVAGKDTHPGGWGCFVIDPASTPTTGLGTVNPASITKVGVQYKTLSTITGTVLNCFWDAVRYGTGLSITSGATDAVNFESIFAVDDSTTYKYGVVTKGAAGTYVVQGLLTFGGTGTENIDFVDKNQIVLFPDNAFVSNTFYGIAVQCGTGTTNFTLGEKSGTAGIKGCLVKAASTSRTYSLNASDGDNDKVLLYGTTFANAGIVTLPPTATNREVLNCTFDTCGQLVANTCVMTSCNFISAVSGSVLLSSSSHQLTSSNFISCSRGVHIDTTGTYGFDALRFAGCTYDIKNSSAGAVVVNATNLSNPSTTENTGGGSITINNAVLLTVQGVKTGTEPTNYVRCRIETASGGTQLMNEEAQTSYGTGGYYKATEAYNYAGDVDVIVRARYKGYLPFETTGTITSAGLTVTAVWQVDPNYV